MLTLPPPWLMLEYPTWSRFLNQNAAWSPAACCMASGIVAHPITAMTLMARVVPDQDPWVLVSFSWTRPSEP